MHAVTIDENEAMSLKESKEGYIVGFGGKNQERRNAVILLKSQK